MDLIDHRPRKPQSKRAPDPATRPRPTGQTDRADRERAAAIRGWATKHGLRVAPTGRISKDVVAAYDAAQRTAPAHDADRGTRALTQPRQSHEYARCRRAIVPIVLYDLLEQIAWLQAVGADPAEIEQLADEYPAAAGGVVMAGRNLTEAQREAADRARRETVEQLHEQLADGIANLDDKDAWQRWLGMAAKLHRYSFNNVMLTMLQKPDATMIAGYRAWQAMGHQVRRGEKAIKILGPVTRKVELVDRVDR